MSFSVGFIGAGNMATALTGGFLDQNFSPRRLAMSDPRPQALQEHAPKGIFTTDDNVELVRRSDVVVLAVKPQVVAEVLVPLREVWQERQPLLLSIAAGVTLSGLKNLLGGHPAMVRAMPNTPALVQCGASGYFCDPVVDEAQCRQAHEILAAVGVALKVEREELIDAVTALSGSGPAYCFLVMEAMQSAGMA
ncbi:MAG: pyrroline-5-carboxylate reductase, partial [Pseudomonadales bacterium]|nr:pyrroline-5-carboxylate reductase [Pseudomonadales bacterium]